MRATIHALFCASILVLLSTSANANVNIVGDFTIDRSEFLDMGEIIELHIDQNLVAKGDRLNIHSSTNGKVLPEPVGQVMVTQIIEGSVIGKVVELTKEITGMGYVAFALPLDEQLNRYLPFIKSLMKTFATRQDIITIAALDVIDQYGNRTSMGDMLYQEISGRICARPQIKCLDSARVHKVVWGDHPNTSRSLDELANQLIKERLGADVLVTGHYLVNGYSVELILQATATQKEIQPRQMWRKFILSPDEFNIHDIEHRITVPYNKVERGGVKISRLSINDFKSNKVDYFYHDSLNGYTGLGDQAINDVVDSDVFITIDGDEKLYPNGEMVYCDKLMEAGNHRVTAGFYPARADAGDGNYITPYKKTIEIDMKAGERLMMNIAGGIVNGNAVIIIDSFFIQ